LLFTLAVPAFSQYAGPAILSRGEAPTGLTAPEIRFTPFVAISAVYDTGLAAVGVTPQGTLGTNSALGTALAWGVAGAHSWRRTRIGLNYTGELDVYPHRSYFDAINQNVFLGLTHQLSRRATFQLNTAAGMYSQLFFPVGLSQTIPFDPTSTYIPTTDFYDNRTVYLSGSGALTYRKTARLSFDFSGDGVIVARRSAALYGTIGYGAGGDLQYRLAPHITVGASYSYQHFDFTRIYGGTDVNQVAATFGIRITARTEFSGYGGAALVENKFVSQVALDPAIAALLGVPTASFVYYSSRWQPAFSGRLSRVFGKGVAYVGAARIISPGNGLFLTSTGTTFLGGYDYGGKWKRWSIGTFSSYIRAQSLGNITGYYGTAVVGVSVARQLFRYTQFVMGFSARHYDSEQFLGYNRMEYNAHVGLAFSPHEVALRIW